MPRLGIDDLAAGVSAIAPDVLRATCTPGVAVALGDESGQVVERAFGFADLARNVPMQVTHTMRAGSLGKLLIATAVMQLVDAGRVSLHAPVSEYLPNYPLRNPLGHQPVTLHHLLTHRSGLAPDSWDAFLGEPPPPGAYLRAELAEGAREYRRSRPRWTSPVGAEWGYSSCGLELVARVVEAVTEEGFAPYASRAILGPLGMERTAWRDSSNWDQVADASATGYMRYGPVWVPTLEITSGTRHSTGLMTTPGAYARLLIALMNGGKAYGTRILASSSVQAMLAPQVEADFYGQSRGMHIGLTTQMRNLGKPTHWVGHGGAYPFGWWCEARAYVHKKLRFVIVVGVNCWDMVRYYNPPERAPTGIIADAAADWMAHRRIPAQGARDPEMASRLMGMVLAERTLGVLGIPGTIPAGLIAAMVEGARPIPGATADEWHPHGFARGIAEMQPHVNTPRAIAEYLASAECSVPLVDRQLRALAWGASRAGDPFGVRQFWGPADEPRNTGGRTPGGQPA